MDNKHPDKLNLDLEADVEDMADIGNSTRCLGDLCPVLGCGQYDAGDCSVTISSGGGEEGVVRRGCGVCDPADMERRRHECEALFGRHVGRTRKCEIAISGLGLVRYTVFGLYLSLPACRNSVVGCTVDALPLLLFLAVQPYEQAETHGRVGLSLSKRELQYRALFQGSWMALRNRAPFRYLTFAYTTRVCPLKHVHHGMVPANYRCLDISEGSAAARAEESGLKIGHVGDLRGYFVNQVQKSTHARHGRGMAGCPYLFRSLFPTSVNASVCTIHMSTSLGYFPKSGCSPSTSATLNANACARAPAAPSILCSVLRSPRLRLPPSATLSCFGGKGGSRPASRRRKRRRRPGRRRNAQSFVDYRSCRRPDHFVLWHGART